MAYWTEVFDIPTSWASLYKDFWELHSNWKPISSNISSVKICLFTRRFLFWTEPVSLNFFTSLYNDFLFGTVSGKRRLNLRQHILHVYFT